MHSSEALLTLAHIFMPHAYKTDIELIKEIKDTFMSINNEDSDEYNAFVIFCDMIFSNPSKTFIIKEDNDIETVVETTCMTGDEFSLPGIELGYNEMVIFKLLKWLYINKYIDEIYEDHQDVLDRYFDEISENKCELLIIDNETEVKKKDVRLRDSFDILKGNNSIGTYEAILSCVKDFRQ